MATGDGKTQGNASTSPFGDGRGGTGGTMTGNDFVKNPAGSAVGGGGADFLVKPAGQGPTGATPMNVAANARGAQANGEAADLNKPSEIRDGSSLVPTIDRPDAGTGSIGNTHKPFKL